MQTKSTTDVKGIDVSNWQGTVNWSSVKSSGVVWAMAKATEGSSYTDPYFTKNVAGAQAVGIKIGGYHFAHPESNDALTEAKHYVAVISQVKLDLLPVLDIESPTDTSRISVANLVNWIQTWINYVEQSTGKEVMIYTGNWFLNNFAQLNNAFANKPLWIANYGNITAPPDGGGWTRWTAWQYASDGTVDGVNGNCDVSVAVSLDALMNGSHIEKIDRVGTVTATSGLHVRKLPISISDVNATLNYNQVIHLDQHLQSEGHGWYRTTYGELGGYVWDQYVQLQPLPAPAPAPQYTVFAGGKTIFASPDRATTYAAGWKSYNGGAKDTYLIDPNNAQYTFDKHQDENPVKVALTPVTQPVQSPVAQPVVTPAPTQASTPAPVPTPVQTTVTQDWRITLGSQAVDDLVSLKILNSPDEWKTKLLENTPNWLVFHLISELAKGAK